MQSFAPSSNPAPRLQQVLDILDRIAQTQGRDVPQILEIEKLIDFLQKMRKGEKLHPLSLSLFSRLSS